MKRVKDHARPATHTHACVVGQAGPGGVEEHGIRREGEVLISDWTRPSNLQVSPHSLNVLIAGHAIHLRRHRSCLKAVLGLGRALS